MQASIDHSKSTLRPCTVDVLLVTAVGTSTRNAFDTVGVLKPGLETGGR